jgi:dihydrodiol dehydrogenase / D-xylose 1-dehydrogenase (NADP)
MSAGIVNWGIVGPGGIAQRFARDLRLVEGARLAAVASRDQQRAEAFAKEFGGGRATNDLAALADDPSVDIVYIASPHNAHFDIARTLLEAGKPVLCEKPLTVNAAQARSLIEISRRRGVFLMEAVWTRFLPIYRRVREWLDGGRIGEPRLVSSVLCVKFAYNPEDRWFNPALAGGGLLDLGVYNLTMTQWVFRAYPEHVAATAHFAATGVDEMLSASLRYPGGRMAQFTCGMTARADNALMIVGEKGFIHVASMFHSATEARLVIGKESETAHEPLRGEGFEYEIEEAMRCVREGRIESPQIPHADTLATMELIDQIFSRIGPAPAQPVQLLPP